MGGQLVNGLVEDLSLLRINVRDCYAVGLLREKLGYHAMSLQPTDCRLEIKTSCENFPVINIVLLNCQQTLAVQRLLLNSVLSCFPLLSAFSSIYNGVERKKDMLYSTSFLSHTIKKTTWHIQDKKTSVGSCLELGWHL